MISIPEHRFHWLMGALFLGSTFVDQGMARLVSSWNPPQASLITVVIGLVWVGRLVVWRGDRAGERERVLDDRIERLERKIGALEDELRERARRPL